MVRTTYSLRKLQAATNSSWISLRKHQRGRLNHQPATKNCIPLKFPSYPVVRRERFKEHLGYPHSQEIFPMNNGGPVGATDRVPQPYNSFTTIIFVAEKSPMSRIFWAHCRTTSLSRPHWKWWFLDGNHPLLSVWWFGTFFIFPYVGNNHPNWLIFFSSVETTNQYGLG